MGNLLRILLGFLFAPTPLWLLACYAMYSSGHFSLTETVKFCTLCAYGPALLFGVPTYLILQRLERRRLWHYLVAAPALPVLLLAAALLIWPDGSFWVEAAKVLPFGAGITAVPFWWIVIRRSPRPGGAPDASGATPIV